MKFCRFSLFFLFFCLGTVIFAQKADSLSEKSNRYLVAKLDSFQFDRQNPLAWVYLNAYIKNAKRKNDFETLFYGYREASYYSNAEEKIVYSDSALIISQKTNNVDLISNAFYTKGRVYYQYRDYKNALDNYLMANETLENSKDQYLKHKILYAISVVKLSLGYYDEVLESLSQASRYFKSENSPDHHLMYLRSLYRTGEVYQAMDDYPKAKETNLLGLQESIKYKEEIQEQYFNLALGIDDYFAEDYALAIQNIEKSLPTMKENGYFEMEEKGNFYIAKSYLGLRQEDKALLYFQKIDSLFLKNHYLPNELRETYEWLIDFYKTHHDKDQQLYYINQLLEVDKINAENNQYLAHKLHKEYDTKRLWEEKKNLERRFTNWQYFAMGTLALLLLTALLYFFKYRKTQKENKLLRSQYETLMKESTEKKAGQNAINPNKKMKEISEDVVENILERLNRFEEKKEFLNPNLDQKSMADKFKTNTAYLSKVINTYKETNFNGYLNNLRINHIIETLKKEPKYRSYSLEAIAKKAGFTSPRQFSDVFLSETGLRPTYFLEQIRKESEVI